MSKKQLRDLSEARKHSRVFSLLVATMVGVGQKVFQLTTLIIGKERKTKLPKSNGAAIAAIGLPGSKWVLGCSAGAAKDIAAGYDMPNKFPNIYTESTAGDAMPLVDSHNNKDDRTTQDNLNDYWVDYDNAAPDPYSHDE